MKEIISILDKKTKKELINLIIELIEEKKIAPECIAEKYTQCKLSEYESGIKDKVLKNVQLEEDERRYITEHLQKRANIKIASTLKCGNAFDSFLAEYKILKHFNNIWKIYPKKVGKDLGKKAFYKLLQDKKLKEVDDVCKYITQKVMNYANYCEDKGIEEQFIMHFSTFCNSKKYL